MFKALGRLSFWLTLASLLFWSGVAYYILSSQPVEKPPSGYPATATECKSRWASTINYDEVRKAAIKYCDEYYAVLGDRTVPLLVRLKERTINRIAYQVIDEYVSSYPPAPGEAVSGKDVMLRLGSERILMIAYETVSKATDPSTIYRRANTRCLLDNARRTTSYQQLAGLPQKCAQN